MAGTKSTLDTIALATLTALGPAPGDEPTTETTTNTSTNSTTDTTTVIVEVAGRQLAVPCFTAGDRKLGESCRPQQLSKKALALLVALMEKELAKTKPQAKTQTKDQPKQQAKPKPKSQAIPPGQDTIPEWLPEGLKPGGPAANAIPRSKRKVLWDNRRGGTRITGFPNSPQAHWVLKKYALRGNVRIEGEKVTLWITGWHVVCQTPSGTCENTPHGAILKRIGAK